MKTPPKTHPKRNRIFRVSRVYETIIYYDVWAANEDDAIDAVDHEDWHFEREEYLGPSDIQDDTVEELDPEAYAEGIVQNKEDS